MIVLVKNTFIYLFIFFPFWQSNMAWRGSNHLLVTRRGIYRFEPRKSHRAWANCKLSSVLGRLLKFRPNKVYLGPGIPSYTFLVYYKDSSIVYIYKKDFCL
jgi:hypothetical protein